VSCLFRRIEIFSVFEVSVFVFLPLTMSAYPRTPDARAGGRHVSVSVPWLTRARKSCGGPGGVSSSVRLRVVDQAETLPASSRERTRQK